MPPFPEPPPVALLLGGVDPSAGAGLFRDALTVAAHGVHPMGISTAETLQNGVTCAQIVPPALSPRLRLALLAPHLVGAWGVKLGMTCLPLEDLEALMRDMASLHPEVAIWDPVAAPTAGVELHGGRDLARMAERLLPLLPWVVAPNRLEALALRGDSTALDNPVLLAEPWLERGASAVWLKGGHASGDTVEDVWVTAAGAEPLGVSARLPGERRGTGCTLASAWLARRLRGEAEGDAARSAAAWLRERWKHSFAPGDVGRPMWGPQP